MFFFKYITILSLLFFSTKAFAQIRISGTVTDADTHVALSGAKVYLLELKSNTTSDQSGKYEFNNIKKGSYLLEVTLADYKSSAQQIQINRDTILNFQLSRTATEVQEVVITGVSRATSLKKSPLIVQTVDAAQLQRGSATNIVDALQSVPGVSQISTGPAISKPIIRGLGYNRVITLNDGIKQEGQQWGDEHGLEIDEYSIDRAEIIKGPGSLMYGSDGIAGVINFLSPKPPAVGQVKTQFLSEYQSNDNLQGYSLMNEGNKNGLLWRGRFSTRLGGDYENKYDGKVFNSGFRELNGNVFLGLNKNWGHSYLTVSSYNNRLGIVEGDRDADGNFAFTNEQGREVPAVGDLLNGYKVYVPYQRINHLTVASQNYFILNKGSINADFGFQHGQRREFADAENPDQVGLDLGLNTFSYNVRYNLARDNGWETSVGVSGMQQTNLNNGTEFLIPDYNLFDMGGFITTQKNFGKLSLSGGIRFDNRYMNTKNLFLNAEGNPIGALGPNDEVKFQHFRNNYNGFSGSVGLAYQTSETSTLKFNLSRGFRAPNIAELASNGVHEGTFRYEIGNPDLKSENSNEIDLAYFIDSKHITMQISPFINFINHYSYIQGLTDANGNPVIPDPSDPVPGFKYTSGKAKLFGGEFYLDVHPHPLDWLHIENSFAYVEGIQSDQPADAKYLPFIPAPKYMGGIKAEFKNVTSAISDLFGRFGVDHFFAQNKVHTAFDTERATPGYTLLNASFGVTLNAFSKKNLVSFFFNIDNLANIAYQDHLSRLQYADVNPITGRIGVFNQGRNFSLKMVVNF